MTPSFQVGDIVRINQSNGSIGKVEQITGEGHNTRLYVRYVYGLDVKGEEIRALSAVQPHWVVPADQELYDEVRLSSPPMWGPRNAPRQSTGG